MCRSFNTSSPDIFNNVNDRALETKSSLPVLFVDDTNSSLERTIHKCATKLTKILKMFKNVLFRLEWPNLARNNIFRSWSIMLCCNLSDYDECSSDPCFNGGVCNNLANNFTCDCPPGWEGYRCNIGRLSVGTLGLYSLRRRRLISIGIPIINLRRSSDRLRFIMGIPIPVRRRLLSE